MPRTKKKAPPAPPTTGIRELMWVDPKTLSENPMNWRKHPNRQKDAIGASIKANGWADTLLFNENTGRLIDGHARREVAIRDGIDSVPVLVGSWTEEQEKHLLATLDPMAAMAETDAKALTSLTDMIRDDREAFAELEEKDQEILETVNEELETYAFNVSVGDDRKTFLPKQKILEPADFSLRQDNDESPFFSMIDEDVVFSSSNEWGIPDLLEDELAEYLPRDTWDRSEESNTSDAWFCQSARPFPEDREGGVLGFFTEDYRFESYWNNKKGSLDKLLREEWHAVCAIDYSLYANEPKILRMYNLYRSRWLARFWQEFGIKIIPIIQGGGEDDEEITINTIPKGAPIIATQCRTISVRAPKRHWEFYKNLLEHAIGIIQPKTCIIYGGLEHKKRLGALPGGCEYVLLDAYMTKRRHKMKE